MEGHQEVVSIVRDHAAFVWRTLRFMGVRPADLDDACQDVFIVVMRKLGDFEGRSSVKTWLRGICVKKAAAYRRRAHQRNEVPVSAPWEQHVPVEGEAPDTPEKQLQSRERLAVLEDALDLLDDAQRAAFVLYEIEGLSMKEVAEALACPLQTAYARYQAARERVSAHARRTAVSATPTPALAKKGALA